MTPLALHLRLVAALQSLDILADIDSIPAFVAYMLLLFSAPAATLILSFVAIARAENRLSWLASIRILTSAAPPLLYILYKVYSALNQPWF
jgi:hypothetical protein